MSFIKFKEEKVWKEWKDKEESLLRDYKFEECKIKELYEYDWYEFKRRRSFGEHQTVSDDLIQYYGQSNDTYEVTSIEAVIDQISDMNLYNVMNQLDSLGLSIVFMKYQGYSSYDISKKLHITVRSIDCKLFRIRKKFRRK